MSEREPRWLDELGPDDAGLLDAGLGEMLSAARSDLPDDDALSRIAAALPGLGPGFPGDGGGSAGGDGGSITGGEGGGSLPPGGTTGGSAAGSSSLGSGSAMGAGSASAGAASATGGGLLALLGKPALVALIATGAAAGAISLSEPSNDHDPSHIEPAVAPSSSLDSSSSVRSEDRAAPSTGDEQLALVEAPNPAPTGHPSEPLEDATRDPNDAPSTGAQAAPTEVSERSGAKAPPRAGRPSGRERAASRPTKVSQAAEANSPPAAPSEFVLIRRARSLLQSAPAESIRACESHKRHYPNGEFAQEREVLAIDALVRLGRRGAAEARASRFRRAHPSSPHGRRIGALLAP